MGKTITIDDWRRFFPFASVRTEQENAINFALNAFFNEGKKFVVMDLPTGVGKSAIGITIASYVNEYEQLGPGFTPGAYVLTTQKILQEQYLKDFGPGKGRLLSIKSSSNYQCTYHQSQTCAESKRVLMQLGKKLNGTEFSKNCRERCPYSIDKQAFINSPLSLTNFSYFFAETMYSGKLEPRNILIVDECHTTADALSQAIEVTFSEKFVKDVLKLKSPPDATQEKVYEWLKKMYKPALAKYLKGLESAIETGIVANTDVCNYTKQYEIIDKHLCKVNRFISHYVPDNWVMNVIDPVARSKRGGKKWEFKPVDVACFGNDFLFKFGQRVVMMSATIIDHELFTSSVGIKKDEYAHVSAKSPFPPENHPIHYMGVGKMSAGEIDKTLPNLVEVIREILKQHSDVKGIIHGTSYKIVNYIRDNLKDPRLLVQDDENRDAILRRHIDSEEPTVLLSPSMSEGVDLKDDLSRFQVFCKVPFPYLGDKIVVKRMEKDKRWYPCVTVRTMIQAAGRSVRNEQDHAASYILDSSFPNFYRQNKHLFPETFRASLKFNS